MDIVARLRICAEYYPNQTEAADEIERLREALRPFAELWLWPDDYGKGRDQEERDDTVQEDTRILRADIRRARAALGEEKPFEDRWDNA